MTLISKLEEFDILDRNADRPTEVVNPQLSALDDPMDLALRDLPPRSELLDRQKGPSGRWRLAIACRRVRRPFRSCWRSGDRGLRRTSGKFHC